MSGDMPVDATPPGESSGESLGQQRTDLAYQRSAEAAERTLMAAVRTGVSMISFGFTIAKFFQYMAKLGMASRQPEVGQAPHHLGLILLSGGALTVVLGLVEYVSYTRNLQRAYGKKIRPTTALFSALFVLAVGGVLIVVLLTELGG